MKLVPPFLNKTVETDMGKLKGIINDNENIRLRLGIGVGKQKLSKH